MQVDGSYFCGPHTMQHRLSNKVTQFLYDPQKHVAPNLFDHEVHLFMHCHIKSYDRTGEGLAMDHDFIDKFGVPNKLEHFWMEGFVFCTFISSSELLLMPFFY